MLVLDLDNTLWGGVIGDDGVDKIQIGRETLAPFQCQVRPRRTPGPTELQDLKYVGDLVNLVVAKANRA